ncbi:MAG: NUDIX hydrolase [Candidatus Woykebacteria bacterium]
MKRGPFKIKSSKLIYKNDWIEVREDEIIRPNGKEGVFGIVEGASGSSIVALTKDNEVYLTEEYRYAQDKITYELPSGAIDKGETPLDSAKRELKEETGLTANKWADLGYINPLTVILKSLNYMFLAEQLREGEAEDEESDLIELKKVSLIKCLEMIEKGQITHAASVVAILKVAKLKEL